MVEEENNKNKSHRYIIGSHDSMTYLSPKRWYLYPIKFMAQCQSKSIEEQYNKYGIRYFDIRVSYDEVGNIEFRHGLISYRGNVDEILEYLNNVGEEVYVRFLLEGSLVGFKIKNLFNSKKVEEEIKRQKILFQIDCYKYERKYNNIKFHCGRSKWDWEVVYEFKNSELSLDQKISSMTWKKIDDWCPFLYAYFMNAKNLNEGTDKEVLLIDFIGLK